MDNTQLIEQIESEMYRDRKATHLGDKALAQQTIVNLVLLHWPAIKTGLYTAQIIQDMCAACKSEFELLECVKVPKA